MPEKLWLAWLMWEVEGISMPKRGVLCAWIYVLCACILVLLGGPGKLTPALGQGFLVLLLLWNPNMDQKSLESCLIGNAKAGAGGGGGGRGVNETDEEAEVWSRSSEILASDSDEVLGLLLSPPIGRLLLPMVFTS